jgi:hypothetical protein
MVTPFAVNELVNGGQLAPAGEGANPAWMVPPVLHREPNPPARLRRQLHQVA